MVKRHLPKAAIVRLFIALLIICALPLCGLTALAADAEPGELFPVDVETVTDDGGRQIIKTYFLTPEQNPADIPRDGFERDGWDYALTDVTEYKTETTDTKAHTETVTINTDSNDLSTILPQLSQTLDYQSTDGYCGLLTLNLESVKCEVAGYKNSSGTVSATREYPNLSNADTSLVPKTVTENGRTLTLDGVNWEPQNTVNVDYDDISESYRAVATYTATVSRSVITGYVTTAEYYGDFTAYTGITKFSFVIPG
jgi:hypothetical protein